MSIKIKTTHKRSISRLMAVQIFYQRDFLSGVSDDKKNLSEIKEDVIENYLLDFEENISSYRGKIDEEFLNNLIAGMSLNSQKIDEEITQFLKDGWSLEKLDGVMLQILRFAAFEIKFIQNIPAKVVIDEYVDLCASFFDEKKVTFANAVLDGLAKKNRAAEFGEKND